MNLFKKLRAIAPWIFATCLFFGALSGFSNTALIVCINKAITSNLTGLYSHKTSFFPIFFSIFASLILLRFFSTWLSQKLVVTLSQKMIENFRKTVCQKLLATPLHEIEKIGLEKIFVVLNNDTQTISQSFILVPPLLINLTIFIGCMIYIALLSLKIFAAISIIIIFGVVSYKLIMSSSTVFFRAARESQDTVSSHFKDLILGIKELKLNASRSEDFKSAALNEHIKQNKNFNIKALTISGFANAWAQALYFIMIGLTLCLPLLFPISKTVIISVIITMLYFTLPLQSIINLLPMWKQAQISAKKIDNLLDLTDHPQQLISSNKASTKLQSIQLEDIERSYHNYEEDHPFHLGPLSLEFKPASINFIVGGNGSGKSTLAKIICGLYQPDQGKIKLNNEVISIDRYEEYRQHFSAVFADFHLFEKLYGLPNSVLNNTTVHHYLDKLNLAHKVSVKDNSFSTLKLSQGQRKRLALLVSYLEDRDIYLFDEWAADQDPIFKDIFYNVLLKELKENNKTVIVISHDDKYFHLANQLIKLEDGKIIKRQNQHEKTS